jgi:hypothetical protein
MISEMLPAFARSLAMLLLLARPESGFRNGKLLYSDDFEHGLSRWSVELEKPGRVEAKNGILLLDVPAGVTVWFRPELTGPVRIEYDAVMMQRGGPNDRVSDLNCFWMATNVHPRTGRFAEYNDLRAYYVGQGGNGNTTTRFRRYIGDPELRPLLPEHDLSAKYVLLTPGVTQHIELVASGDRVQYVNNGRVIFDFHDPAPYTHGQFGFRTTFSHVELRHFRIYRLR